MDEVRERTLWGVTWFHENTEGVLEDTDFVFAYSEQDALEKWFEVDNVPEGAKVLLIEKAE